MTLEFDPIASAAGGAFYYRSGKFRLIVIDPALTRRERAAALAHELVHDELGPCEMFHDPAVLCRDETRVRTAVAAWLVPVEQLAQFCTRVADLGYGVTAADVAEEFDTTLDVAQRALEMLSPVARGEFTG